MNHSNPPETTSTASSTPGILSGIVLFAFVLLGLCGAAFAMYAAWQHNPQGEFYDEAGVHWVDWGAVGLFWFAVIAGIPCLIAIAFRFRKR